MNFPFTREVFSENDTVAVANEFAEHIHLGDVIALSGSLGSGKTFFVKAVGVKFGVDNISSPSFAIVNEYQGKIKINHFDFYRIKKIEELYDIGYEEYLSDSDAVCFIEWAEMFPELMPKKYYQINIEFKSDSERIITIEKK